MACTNCGWRKDITGKDTIRQYCDLCNNMMKVCGRVQVIKNSDINTNPFYNNSNSEEN